MRYKNVAVLAACHDTFKKYAFKNNTTIVNVLMQHAQHLEEVMKKKKSTGAKKQ